MIIYDYDYDYSGLRLRSLYTRSIAYINAQIKLSILIIITLNTLIMKYKSEVIKIIIYCRFKFNEEFVTTSLVR